jgi:hypothetical protein
MTLANIHNGTHEFKLQPHNKGGSKKGKPSTRWPIIIKLVGQAIFDRYCKTDEAAEEVRKYMTVKVFEKLLNGLLPGWKEYRESQTTTSTTSIKLLRNRCYKAWYKGTSVGNKNPNTRAQRSDEHWKDKYCLYGPVGKLVSLIKSEEILCLPDWKDIAHVTNTKIFEAELDTYLTKGKYLK